MNRPAREAIVRTRNIALVTGFRLKGLANTNRANTRVRAEKI